MRAAEGGAPPQTWRITGGNPDAEETAAVMAVLTALLAGAAEAEPEQPPRKGRAGWDRTPADAFRTTGTWRRH
ncbi:acyl-CoA carboxylase epsilon subunit [Streptomyces sp. NPDC044571]|uniref:acyl-CoA carboxylase epsilon subunit n=1 Tax=Streptomyces sp. NPDC044571 TaxID=3155371 RepID=UPI0033D44B7C